MSFSSNLYSTISASTLVTLAESVSSPGFVGLVAPLLVMLPLFVLSGLPLFLESDFLFSSADSSGTSFHLKVPFLISRPRSSCSCSWLCNEDGKYPFFNDDTCSVTSSSSRYVSIRLTATIVCNKNSEDAIKSSLGDGNIGRMTERIETNLEDLNNVRREYIQWLSVCNNGKPRPKMKRRTYRIILNRVMAYMHQGRIMSAYAPTHVSSSTKRVHTVNAIAMVNLFP